MCNHANAFVKEKLWYYIQHQYHMEVLVRIWHNVVAPDRQYRFYHHNVQQLMHYAIFKTKTVDNTLKWFSRQPRSCYVSQRLQDCHQHYGCWRSWTVVLRLPRVLTLQSITWWHLPVLILYLDHEDTISLIILAGLLILFINIYISVTDNAR